MIRKGLIFCLLLMMSIVGLSQEVKLPRLFRDHAVLQRDTPVRFWGWAEKGTEISVKINGFEVSTLTDASGKWELLFPAQPAGGPYLVSVNEINLKDVHFGDVWVAGGQSNMEWQVGANINNMIAEIADSDYPEIRFFKVAHDISVTPKDDLSQGDWKVANSENVKNFSAVAWFFAKKNQAEKGVAVGIIDDNWGGTPAESWTSPERLLSVEGYKDEAAAMLNPEIDWDKKFRENEQLIEEKYRRVQDQEDFLKYKAHLPDFDDENWSIVTLPNAEALTDFVWLRKSIELNKVSDVKISPGHPGKFTVLFINGQKVYTKTWADDPSIIKVPKEVLKEGRNVIAIRTAEDWDNRVFIGREGEMWLDTGKKKIPLNGDWKFSNTVEPPMPEAIRYEHSPGTLFNAMINPIAGYSIKGAIWYQGEANAVRAHLYKDLFTTMIEDWRLQWRQGRFPFLFCQLANWQQQNEQPTESSWAELQEAQTQTLELANTGMACLIDLGEADDIHPRNKQDVGHRLWLAARKVAFGEDLVFSGPLYSGHEFKDGQAIVSFDLFGSDLEVKGDKIFGFALAGEDKKFKWAEARIDGQKIMLSSKNVPNPKFIRYAWADNPACNLYNAEGLPAVPFRTDE